MCSVACFRVLRLWSLAFGSPRIFSGRRYFLNLGAW